MGFQVVVLCCRKTGYLYEFDLYLGKKEKTELGLEETVVLNLSKKLENIHCILYFDNIFVLQHWLISFSIGKYTALVQFKVTRKIWLL